ncbi:PI31 proteasome regulator N-terminal-domain-containing protein [Thermothelomyces heterothallicus CBS 202.75]|uniref:PI31 proteasome regulator N-terminal-domain-containing protein n=1 Tax=Thermothelomyces heterothallicus CBS 202.75 TaxID=1149848 RepID=UPI0037427418
MAPSDPLGPAAVLKSMADALPLHENDDTAADLKNPLDSIALCVHACMVNLDFRLLGFDEDHTIEEECARHAPNLPPQWNTSSGSRGFVYAHTQSAMRFVLHVDRLGAKVEIRGLATGDERIARFDITANDYVSPSALPLRVSRSSEGTQDKSDLVRKLKTVFISEERIKDLASLLKITIVQRLLPALQKEGYAETPAPPARASPPPPRRPDEPSHLPPPAAPHPYPAPDPLAAPPPHRPVPAGDFPPPGFEDEYEINRPPGRPGPALAPAPGLGGFGRVGHDDLYPAGLGPHDPIVGSFTGGGIGPGGLRRPGGPGTGGMGGGMHPTFDDPLFRGPGGRGGQGEEDDTFGGQVPPGARWDPVGPGGQPRFGGGRGPRGGGGFGGFGGFGGGDII